MAKIPYPEKPRGAAESRTDAIYSYLYRLAEALNIALPTGGTQTAVTAKGGTASTVTAYNQLQGYISKSVDKLTKETAGIAANLEELISELNTVFDELDLTIQNQSEEIERLKQVQEEVKDRVTERGSSGGWEYRKWSSGRAELWTRQSLDTGVLSAAAAGIYRSGRKMFSLPFELQTGAEAFVSVCEAEHVPIWAVSVKADTASLSFAAAALTESTAALTLTMQAYINGFLPIQEG